MRELRQMPAAFDLAVENIRQTSAKFLRAATAHKTIAVAADQQNRLADRRQDRAQIYAVKQ